MRIITRWRYLKSDLVKPSGYGFAYSNFECAEDVFYPIPLNYVIRYSRSLYWRFLRIFYWIGLIDVGVNEAFSWRDFYRIKLH